MKVITLVGLFLLFQLVVAIFTKMTMSSEVLHLVGAGVGFPAAILMLKLDWVDCEHWDLFSVWSGRNTMSDLERDEADDKKPARVKQRAKEEQGRRAAALQHIHEIVHGGQALFALKAHQRMARELPEWTLPEADLLALIQSLHEQKLWAESIAPMAEYLALYSQKAALVRLKLAQILVVQQNRPAQALESPGQDRPNGSRFPPAGVFGETRSPSPRTPRARPLRNRGQGLVAARPERCQEDRHSVCREAFVGTPNRQECLSS